MNYKLRIKHPSGAEFEAEGPADFILAEKEGFIKGLPAAMTAGEAAAARPTPAADGQEKPPNGEPDWSALADTGAGLPVIRRKHFGLKAAAAALVILAAGSKLLGSREMSAIALSKAVKASGFAPERLDRTLGRALRDGLVLASGTKRNRSYEITDRGLEMAWLEARKLSK